MESIKRKKEGKIVDFENKENKVQNALERAGLFKVKALKQGTEVYNRLISTAEKYITEVKRMELTQPILSDSENYSSVKKSSSSDTIRREYHNQLSIMLLGVPREGLPKEEACKISNFAAYVTGNEIYVDRW
jgi:cobalamin biosynthesis Co2+ chelatase CbiK